MLANYEFKPTPVSILLAASFIVLFCLLGRWQLHRAAEKQAIVEAITSRAEAPELELLAHTGSVAKDALWHRHAMARGRLSVAGSC